MPTPLESFHTLAEREPWIRFDWASAELDGVVYPHAAMMIPFEDATTREKLQLQFDTGAPRNLLYEKALLNHTKSRAVERPGIGDRRQFLKMRFDGSFPETDVGFSPKENFDPNNAAQDEARDEAPLVGTLGLAFLGNAGFAIDYPRQRIYVLSKDALDQLEARYPADFHPYLSSFRNLENKIVLPFGIEGKEDVAIFDTGTSMFEMQFPPQQWQALTHVSFDQADKTIRAPSWGEYLSIYGKQVHFDTVIGGRRLAVSEIYSSSSPEVAHLSIIGNKLFLDHILVFDKRRMVFSIF